MAVALAATMAALPSAAHAQQPPDPAVSAVAASPREDSSAAAAQDTASGTAGARLPVSIDRIKSALEEPAAPPLVGVNTPATYTIQIEERQRIRIEDLINSLDFRSGPTPAGGLYAYQQQRQMFPPSDYPLRQPLSEFSQPELTTILIENLAGHYLAARVADGITAAQRAEAEARAREEFVRAVTEYCAAQPRGGAGIQICAAPAALIR